MKEFIFLAALFVFPFVCYFKVKGLGFYDQPKKRLKAYEGAGEG